MEHISVICAPGCDHTLTAESFSVHWEKGWVSRELVLSQLEKVLPSYEKAKAAMSRQGVHELYSYLKTTRWASNAGCVSSHQAYKYFRGQSSNRPNQPCPYYPYFFLMQALFPESEGVKKMNLDMEHLWGVRLDFKQPFYPRLDDVEQERKLIMGHVQSTGPNNLSAEDFVMPSVPKTTPYPGLSTGQSIAASSKIDEEPNYTLAATEDQVDNNPSDNNCLYSYEKELSSIRNDFEKRLSDVQSYIKLQRDAAGI